MKFIHASGDPSHNRIFFIDGETDIKISNSANTSAKIRIDD